ncbi:hypothetical protein FACS189437_08080 [Bacteroidia bacterium]|nr:hypothetical protein FACS189437_08080 [Bacteroidia bacterium]
MTYYRIKPVKLNATKVLLFFGVRKSVILYVMLKFPKHTNCIKKITTFVPLKARKSVCHLVGVTGNKVF